MFCLSCQMTYQQGARFCGRCGSPLAVQSLTPSEAEPEGRMALAGGAASTTGEAMPGSVAIPREASPVSRQGRLHVASFPEGGAEEADAAPTLLLRPGDHTYLNLKVLGSQSLPKPSQAPMPRRESTPDMDFFAIDDLLNEEESRIRELVADFCQREVAPLINDYWEREAFPFELLPKLARLRIAGGTLQGYGCPGMSAVAAGLAVQELSRGDSGLCTFFGNHTFLAMRSIALYGSEEQKQRWLPAMARMEKIGGFALTEQNLSSSDASNLGTLARRVGNTYMLTGTKRWIVNATFADVMVVWARDEKGHIGAFLVEKGTPGFEARIIPGKMSQRTLWCTDITLNQVQIPLENRLPGVHSFQSAIELLTGTRVTVSWIATGLAMAAYEVALDYAKQRKQFGRPLAAFQMIQYRLATMVSKITSMQLMSLRLSQL
ncbi:MAG TPA: acyl-CoA dehydrogenase family protein, partial [Ktedonobacteraceae bacterium]